MRQSKTAEFGSLAAFLMVVLILWAVFSVPWVHAMDGDLNSTYLLALEMWEDATRSRDRASEARALELFSKIVEAAGPADDERELAAACLVYSARISHGLDHPVAETLDRLVRVIDDFDDTSWVTVACQMIKSLKAGTPLPDTALLRSIISLETTGRKVMTGSRSDSLVQPQAATGPYNGRTGSPYQSRADSPDQGRVTSFDPGRVTSSGQAGVINLDQGRIIMPRPRGDWVEGSLGAGDGKVLLNLVSKVPSDPMSPGLPAISAAVEDSPFSLDDYFEATARVLAEMASLGSGVSTADEGTVDAHGATGRVRRVDFVKKGRQISQIQAYFMVDGKAYIFTLADTPGTIDQTREIFDKVIEKLKFTAR